jgi:hypothetical protein
VTAPPLRPKRRTTPDTPATPHLSTLDAAKVVLEQAGGPLHVKELAEKILALPGVKLAGKTPAQTVAAAVGTAARKGDRFVKTAPNTFDLKDRA